MTVTRVGSTVPNVDTDASGLGHFIMAEQVALDGSGTPQQLGCTQISTVFPSATRTATTISSVFENRNARGIALYLNVTAASGTGGLKAGILSYDPVSGNKGTMFIASTLVTTTGTFVYVLYPGIGVSYGTFSANGVLLPEFVVEVTHADGTNYTYSLAMELIL